MIAYEMVHQEFVNVRDKTHRRDKLEYCTFKPVNLLLELLHSLLCKFGAGLGLYTTQTT